MAQSTWNLIFNDIKFYGELNFAKIKFQNRDILLDNFKRMTFYYIVLKLRVFTHFGLEIAILVIIHYLNIFTINNKS